MNTINVLAAKYGTYQRPVYWILKIGGKPSLQYIDGEVFAKWKAEAEANGYTVKVTNA